MAENDAGQREADEERFMRLETKVAYQEKLIADLNDVLLDHTKVLDRLEARLRRLEQTLRDQAGEPVGHERPPHY